MRERVFAFIRYYLFWVVFFAAQKPFFMLWQRPLLGEVAWTDWWLVPWHGLPLDLSVAAYITVFYGLLLCVGFWLKDGIIRKVATGYTAVVLVAACLVTIGDNGCFPFWGYHLDRDIFDYLASPKEVFACAPWWQWLSGLVAVAVLFAVWWWVYRFLVVRSCREVNTNRSKVAGTAVLLVLTALLFLPMRGSVSVSTMNTGRAYYSENRMLNLAAVNPLFNLVESLSENALDGKRYHYMASDEALQLLADLRPNTGQPSEYLLTTDRPHIVLVILESFSKNALFAMPNLQRLAAEGLYFSNMYANSFRTDRGLMAILGAFPGCATASIMTMPSMSSQLPQIGQVLKEEGYELKFYYGGDEDFTNMRSYLITGGFEQRVCDRDFPFSARLSKWGVPDHILFDYAARDIVARQNAKENRQFDVVLSLSSHEPFEVPYQHYTHPYINAVAYTDSCLGAFVDTLRESAEWPNTLLMLMPDHGYPYPDGIQNFDTLRYAIPCIMAGGAVSQPREITTRCSQIDWVATLLHQMNLSAGQFDFSKDILDPTQKPYAYYHFVDGFALMTDEGTTIIDAVTNQTILETTPDSLRREQARAITQCIYESL